MPEGGGRGEPRPRNASTASTRGRRNPALLAQQAPPDPQDGGDDNEPALDDLDGGADDREAMLAGAGEQLPEDLPILFAGDVVMGKASVSTKIMGMEHWFTWGISSRVQPGEDAEDAFMRVGAQVSESVMDLMASMEVNLIREESDRQERERNRPIRRRNH